VSVERLLLWAHPLLGWVAVALMVRAARLGVRARAPGTTAARGRAAHVRLTPWALGVVVIAWLGGVATVWLDRADMSVAESGHFSVGSAIVVLLATAAGVSRWVPSEAWARQVHPWLGAAAVLLAGVQVFLGLQIMPP
jgi:Protein of unknown function (DUF4079)